MLDLARLVDDPRTRAEVRATEIAELFSGAAQAANVVLNAFITLTPDLALADAARVDAARAAGSAMPLDGMPIAIKDNMDLAGWPTSAASRSTSTARARVDAEAVRRVRQAGGIVIGKTNLHELAFGATTANPPPYGITRNPWDHGRIAGGSSGGTAAAVAADLCIGGLGSDTGGSVRAPAALTGLTGLRPTIGRISTRGVLPLSWSFDTVGPIARTARDAGRLYRAMAGWDPEDPRSDRTLGQAEPWPDEARTCAGIRIGTAEGFFSEQIAPDVAAATQRASGELASLDAAVEPLTVAFDESMLADVAAIIRAEAYALHKARYEEEPTLFGEEIRERFEIAKAIEGWQVGAAMQRAYEFRQSLRSTFDRVDVILSPATRTTAPLIGGRSIDVTWELMALTYPWTFAGVPAMSIPVGPGQDGMPIGVQLAAAWGREELLLGIASVYQEATSWHRQRPALASSVPVA